MKRKAIVIDIDNCVLNTQFILDEIHKLGLKGEDKWEYFYKNCNSDRVLRMKGAIELFRQFSNSGNAPYIFFSTARNEKCKEATLNKLWKEGFIIPDDAIFMRPYYDLRSACEVKREHLIEIMKEFDIIAFIDDDLQNCEMAKSLGVLALRRV